MLHRFALPLGVAVAAAVAACSSTPDEPPPAEPWPLVYSQDFETPWTLDGFALSDPADWTWNNAGNRGSMELHGKGTYVAPHRSPASIALVPDLLLADFDMEVDLMQTGRDYGHRDMCIFLGFRSPAHYDYVHLAHEPDPRAHNIFRVAEAPRVALAKVPTEGIIWGSDWHRVRIERRTETGSIQIFWDAAEEPILVAEDTSFDWGRIGFGSFDDSGRVASIRIWAPEVRQVEEAQPFAATPTR